MWSDQVDIGLCTSGCLDAEQSPNTVFGWLCLLVGDSRAERPLCFVNTETPALFSFFSVLMERGSQVLESDTTLPGKLYVGEDTQQISAFACIPFAIFMNLKLCIQ